MRPHTLFEGSNFVDVSPGQPERAGARGGLDDPDRADDELRHARRGAARPATRDPDEPPGPRRGRLQERSRARRSRAFQETLKKAPDLTKALAPAARAAQGTTRTELAGTIQGFSRTVDEVAEREEDQLIPIAQRANATMAALTVDGAQPLDDALVALPKTLRELRGDGADRHGPRRPARPPRGRDHAGAPRPDARGARCGPGARGRDPGADPRGPRDRGRAPARDPSWQGKRGPGRDVRSPAAARSRSSTRRSR